MQNHGLKAREFSVSDDALLAMVRVYTREAGVRNMDPTNSSSGAMACTEARSDGVTRSWNGTSRPPTRTESVIRACIR